MGLTLYDNPLSSNALKVRFLLAELGLQYESVEVPFDRPRPDRLTRFHPVGGIPALADDDFRLGESNTILRYLAAREGRGDLYPGDLRERARVDWALDTWSTFVRPAIFPLEVAAGVLGPRDQAALEAALPRAEEMLDTIERFVAHNGTVTGSFTIADCCAAPTLFRSRALPLDFVRWPKLGLLRKTLTVRPAFQQAGPVR